MKDESLLKHFVKDFLNIVSDAVYFGIQVPGFADAESHACQVYSLLNKLPYFTKLVFNSDAFFVLAISFLLA